MWENHKFEHILETLKESLVVQKQILAALNPPSNLVRSLTIVFYSKGESMPLTLPDNVTDTYSILGKDAAGLQGALLAAGQTLSVVSSDPTTVIITPDATPLPTPAGLSGSVPAGLPTIGSGVVGSAQPPANPNNPITVTATVLNADGSTFATISDTVTIAPGTAATIGELFGGLAVSVKKK